MPETIDNDAPYASPAHAKQVEASLSALQDKHRLAIHQWEYKQNAYEQPAYLKNFNNDPRLISPCLEAGKRLPLRLHRSIALHRSGVMEPNIMEKPPIRIKAHTA